LHSGFSHLLAKGEKVIRFVCPVEPGPTSQVLLHSRLRVPPGVTEVSLMTLQPAPWAIYKEHWQGQPTVAQTAQGAVRLVEQTACTRFVDVISRHVIDGVDYHVFCFQLNRCSDTGTGLKVGVCTVDGQQQWMLRLSDGRMCDRNGTPSGPCLIEPRLLPSRLVGCKVSVGWCAARMIRRISWSDARLLK
jgi:hypothetical protein